MAAPFLSINDLIAIGLGELKWPVDVLLSTRLSFFLLALQGHRQAEETKYRQAAELVRLQTVELINIQLPRRDKIKSPAALWPLPWDTAKADSPTAQHVTPEAAQLQLQRLIQVLNP